MTYNPKIVLAYFKECGLPAPEVEYKFSCRKYKFDFAWCSNPNDCRYWVALEVEGGIWTRGAHGRGSGIKRDMDKYNLAAMLGWRVLRVEPKDLCTQDTVDMIRQCTYPWWGRTTYAPGRS